MSKLKLDRPLAFIDIEATGISPRADRIVELAVVKLMPDGERITHVYRINPEMPIPPEVTRIHGITDADVADSPKFREVAEEIFAKLENCDLAGYNVARYDIPMLTEEFQRADIGFDTEQYRIIDVQRIFHRREPRDLTAAMLFYCNERHENAHGAQADVEATIKVLLGQFKRYPDLPHDVASLDEYCNPRDPIWVDRIGRLKWANGEVVLNFSRKKGTPLRDVIKDDPGFAKWILRSDFPRDVKRIVEDAMDGKWPSPPVPTKPEEQSGQMKQDELGLQE